MAARCWEVTVPTSADASEGLTNLLWELGALGVVEEETPAAAPRLRAFFADTHVPDRLSGSVRAYLDGLRTLGFHVSGEPAVQPLSDPGWADAWRAHFRPLVAGRTLLIAPPWEVPSPAGRTVITIEPGRAFGTGHHGSTLGCLEALETIVDEARPASALDLGTGSGILAIAAVRLGVPRVVAIDTDPDAVAAATLNAAQNGVAARVTCELGDTATADVAAAPLVLANLLAPAHRALAGRYRELVAPDGRLVLGGILDAERETTASAVTTDRVFAVRTVLSHDGWTTLDLHRAPIRPRA